jgi:hypothetical protein
VVLIDREFEAGDEPVKVCVRDGAPIGLRKRLAAELIYDTIGESVASASTSTQRAAWRPSCPASPTAAVATCRTRRRCAICCRSAVRISKSPVKCSAWIEIDFPDDVVRAAHEVLPQL